MDAYKDKTVFITGIAGFIGSNLARKLVACGSEVHGLIRKNTILWRIKDLLPLLKLHIGDLNDHLITQQILHQIQPDIIYHLACHGEHPTKQKERMHFLESGVLGTANLLNATTVIPFERLIAFGSSLEYGPRKTALHETTRLKPTTYRGVVKAASTLLCQQHAREFNRPIIILRPFSVYGYWEAPTRLIPVTFLAAIHDEKIALTAPGYHRDLIFIDDLIEACMLVSFTKLNPGDVINIGSGKQWSNEQIVEYIQSICGRKIEVQIGKFQTSPSDTNHWRANIEKAERLLGWKPRHSLKHGLKDFYLWLKQHLDEYETAYRL